MADTYLVQVNLERLVANLGKAENRAVDAIEAIAFVTENGFLPQPDRGADWFLVEEASIDLLDRSEIRGMREWG